MRKNEAAVVYGVGARLDEQPRLLFRLRGVDETELIAGMDAAPLLSTTTPAADKMLVNDDLSALFGLAWRMRGRPWRHRSPSRLDANRSKAGASQTSGTLGSGALTRSARRDGRRASLPPGGERQIDLLARKRQSVMRLQYDYLSHGCGRHGFGRTGSSVFFIPSPSGATSIQSFLGIAQAFRRYRRAR
jgi:hypothetical protein